jgi:processive 1,2-diacylglycerol beta-glucosyltransferase
LIISVSVGAGHLRAAQAIEKAFGLLGAAKEVRNVDALQYTNKLFHKLYSKAYIDIVNKTPEVWGWLYDQFDRPWHNERLRLAFDKLNTRPFVKMLEQYQPDMTVCTHFLPAEIISWLKEKHRLHTPQVITITDFDIHAMWLCRHYEHYFVALDETKAHLEELGVPPEKVTATGIPIDPVFAEHKDRVEMRRKLGLDLSLTTVLVSAGGLGVGPIGQLIQSLTKLQHKAQVVAICGKNKELKARIDELVAELPTATSVKFKSIGFTSEMDSYMSAADLVLGKTGGLTTAETLAKGLGFVIVNPIRGQEERNADHLLEEGAAIRCNNLPVLAYKVDRLLDDPGKLAAMQANARRLGRPNAACDIVTKLIAL